MFRKLNSYTETDLEVIILLKVNPSLNCYFEKLSLLLWIWKKDVIVRIFLYENVNWKRCVWKLRWSFKQQPEIKWNLYTDLFPILLQNKQKPITPNTLINTSKYWIWNFEKEAWWPGILGFIQISETRMRSKTYRFQ